MFRKLILSTIGVFLCMSISLADDYTIPIDKRNMNPGDVNLVGVDSYYINVSTIAVMITSTTYTNERGGVNPLPYLQPCIVYGILISSSDSSQYLVLRDTNIPNITSTAKCQNIYADAIAPTIVTFPAPVKFYNGCSANLSGGTGQATCAQVTILFRRLSGKDNNGK